MNGPVPEVVTFTAQINRVELVRILSTQHVGRASRVKAKDLCSRLFGYPIRNGHSSEAIALLRVVSDLALEGCPIGSVTGASGGIYWIESDEEREHTLNRLRATRAAIDRRISALEASA